jgi:hypothetical protein
MGGAKRRFKHVEYRPNLSYHGKIKEKVAPGRYEKLAQGLIAQIQTAIDGLS